MSIYIEKLSFVSGHKIDSPSLEFSPGNVTILVGPNNSGKSQALKDIDDLCKGSNISKVVKSVEITRLQTTEEIEALLEPHEQKSLPNGNPLPSGNRFFSQPSPAKETPNQIQINPQEINEWINNFDDFKDRVVQFCVIRLDGKSRFELVKPKKITSLQNLPVNHLDILFRDDEKREKIRRTTEDTFGLYFVVDRTGDNLCIRMSRKPPPSNEVERGGDNNSIEFHKNADLITDLGDGVQTFVGLIAGLSCLSHTIILIDEPEAFLAPSVAKRLGREIINITQERKASLIVATHSADFVMGCIESSNEPKIIRLTYENQKASAREVETDIIREFNTNPCLRSSSAIRGLFYKGIIVTEGHRDRVFYDEVNHRLLENKGIGATDVLFIDSGGGINMIYKTVEPLRKMGVPAVAVVDIDFITKPDIEWENLIKACQINNDKQEYLRKECNDIIQELKSTLNIPVKNSSTEEGRNKEAKKFGEKIKKKGINNFLNTVEAYDKTKKFIDLLAEYGLFIVPIGELESWIPELPKKPNTSLSWDNDVFQKLGTPEESDFNDWWGLNKWSFMNKIAMWINDSNRKGVM